MNNEFDPNDMPDFKIPESFLNQLNEFSNGGYILFTFTAKGSPVAYHNIDDDAHYLALLKSIERYSVEAEIGDDLDDMDYQEDDEY